MANYVYGHLPAKIPMPSTIASQKQWRFLNAALMCSDPEKTWIDDRNRLRQILAETNYDALPPQATRQ